MADEPQVPDLEVNLPMPGGLKVTRDLPYRILIAADLAGGEGGTLAGPLATQTVEVNAGNFDEVLAAAAPTVTFKTTDPTQTGAVMAEVALTFKSLKDFQPAALAAQLPATAGLSKARAQLVARLRGQLSAAQLAAEIGKLVRADAGLTWLTDALKWTPSAAGAEPGAVDDLLGQLDLGEPADQPVVPDKPRKTSIGAAIAAAAGAGGTAIPAEEASALRRTLGQIDRNLSAWLTTILRAAPVQALEARWRSLAFVMSKVDFRKGVRVLLLHAPQAELVDRLVGLVIDPVFDAGHPAPDLIVVDAQFGNTAPEIETLDSLAQHAASLPAVVVTGVAATFFGIKHAWQVPTLSAFGTLFDGWQFAKLKTLRTQAYARHLGLIFGRGLLRTPYSADASGSAAATEPATEPEAQARGSSAAAGGAPAGGTGDFIFREEWIADTDCLWANAPIVAACTVARSIAETGWPASLVGKLVGFVTATGGKKGEKQFGPTDTNMKIEKAEELIVSGLNALVGLPKTSDVVLCNGFSMASMGKSEGLARLEVALPYQLFAGRLSALLLELKAHLAGLSSEKMVATVLAHARDWLSTEHGAPEEQQVSVQARPAEKGAGTQLAVTVTPPQDILIGGVPIVLGYVVE